MVEEDNMKPPQWFITYMTEFKNNFVNLITDLLASKNLDSADIPSIIKKINSEFHKDMDKYLYRVPSAVESENSLMENLHLDKSSEDIVEEQVEKSLLEVDKHQEDENGEKTTTVDEKNEEKGEDSFVKDDENLQITDEEKNLVEEEKIDGNNCEVDKKAEDIYEEFMEPQQLDICDDQFRDVDSMSELSDSPVNELIDTTKESQGPKSPEKLKEITNKIKLVEEMFDRAVKVFQEELGIVKDGIDKSCGIESKPEELEKQSFEEHQSEKSQQDLPVIEINEEKIENKVLGEFEEEDKSQEESPVVDKIKEEKIENGGKDLEEFNEEGDNNSQEKNITNVKADDSEAENSPNVPEKQDDDEFIPTKVMPFKNSKNEENNGSALVSENTDKDKPENIQTDEEDKKQDSNFNVNDSGPSESDEENLNKNHTEIPQDKNTDCDSKIAVPEKEEEKSSMTMEFNKIAPETDEISLEIKQHDSEKEKQPNDVIDNKEALPDSHDQNTEKIVNFPSDVTKNNPEKLQDSVGKNLDVEEEPVEDEKINSDKVQHSDPVLEDADEPSSEEMTPQVEENTHADQEQVPNPPENKQQIVEAEKVVLVLNNEEKDSASGTIDSCAAEEASTLLKISETFTRELVNEESDLEKIVDISVTENDSQKNQADVEDSVDCQEEIVNGAACGEETVIDKCQEDNLTTPETQNVQELDEEEEEKKVEAVDEKKNEVVELVQELVNRVEKKQGSSEVQVIEEVNNVCIDEEKGSTEAAESREKENCQETNEENLTTTDDSSGKINANNSKHEIEELKTGENEDKIKTTVVDNRDKIIVSDEEKKKHERIVVEERKFEKIVVEEEEEFKCEQTPLERVTYLLKRFVNDDYYSHVNLIDDIKQLKIRERSIAMNVVDAIFTQAKNIPMLAFSLVCTLKSFADHHHQFFNTQMKITFRCEHELRHRLLNKISDVQFICNLYQQGLIPIAFIHKYIQYFFQRNQIQDVEPLCQLVKLINQEELNKTTYVDKLKKYLEFQNISEKNVKLIHNALHRSRKWKDTW